MNIERQTTDNRTEWRKPSLRARIVETDRARLKANSSEKNRIDKTISAV